MNPLILNLRTSWRQVVNFTSLPLCPRENDACTCRITRWRVWLRHCATRRKVAGSTPDKIIGILHLHNPSGRTVVLGVDSASNKSKYRVSFLEGKGGRCVGLPIFPP